MTKPAMTLDEVQKFVEANSNANRVTKETMEAKIDNVQWYDMPGTLTICVITMQNGFTFTGKSACADPANFNKEVGHRYAYEDAFKQIWSHEAYLIRERMFRGK